MNANLPRWVKASVAQYFNTELAPLKLFIEGETSNKDDFSEWVELRTDGPYFREGASNTLRVDIAINMLVQCKLDGSVLYQPETISGTVAEAFKDCIPVYKYGGRAGDDSTFVDHLWLRPQSKGDVNIYNMGQVADAYDIVQVQVEGQYCNDDFNQR
jgi:hypothetical protein